MNKCCGFIYKTGRDHADLTQEKAVEALHVSIRALSDYENGKVVPPDDVVMRMAEVYKYPQLEWLHLYHNNPIGQRILPEYQQCDLPMATVRFIKEHGDVSDLQRRILAIAADGVITEDEMPEWRIVTREITEMLAAAVTLLFIPLTMTV
jgi:transcriptional regulator with XRE-family HTH domain